MRVEQAEKPKPRPGALVLAGRVLYGIMIAIAVCAWLFGIFLVGYGFLVEMPAHRPTAASLTFGAGVVVFVVGWMVLVIGRMMRRVLGGE